MSSNPSPACFSLQGTKTCMMYSQYSVYPSKDQFDNLVSFDRYMSDFSPSNQNFQTYVRSQLGCPEYKGEAIDNLQAFFCGYIMQTSTLSFQCNAQTPNPICRSNAAATINSFEKLKRDVCKSNGSFQVPQFMKNYSSSLSIDDPSGKTCILGLESNGSSGNSTPNGSSGNSTSANSVNELPNSLKIGGTYFIVGVSVGSAILLIIVIITAIICIKRSRKDKPVIPHQNEDDFETMDVIYEYVPNLFDEIQLCNLYYVLICSCWGTSSG